MADSLLSGITPVASVTGDMELYVNVPGTPDTDGRATVDQVVDYAAGSFVPSTRSVSAGTGLTGGGDLSTNRTIGLDSTSVASLGLADTAVQPGDLGDSAGLNVGTTAGTVAAGDDSRFTNARTPTAHASTHVSGGSDIIRNATAAQDGLMTLAYAAKLDGIEAGADVTDATNVAAAGAVMDTGDETIAGVKTFSSFPVTPSSAPTTDYQVANKKYVDDNAGGSGVKLLGYIVSTTEASTAAAVPGDATIPQASEMTAYPSLDITVTPSDPTAIIEVIADVFVAAGTAAASPVIALFVDSNANALDARALTLGAQELGGVQVRFLAVAGSGARTYKVYFAAFVASNTVYINRNHATADLWSTAALSSITVKEYPAP